MDERKALEKVLVLKRSDLKGYLPRRDVFLGDVADVVDMIEGRGTYMERRECESDPDWKQLIPYIALVYKDQVFTYRRLSAGGEERLHNLVSIGVGGHVNHLHDDATVNWHMNIAREVHEELHLKTPYSLHPYGVLNEDITDVCRVHLGLVYVARVEDPDAVSVREVRELEGAWYSMEALSDLEPFMEEWSKILLGSMKGEMP